MVCKQAGKHNTYSKKGNRVMKKYRVIVDKDYQTFNENYSIKGTGSPKRHSNEKLYILDKLFELRNVDF